DGRACWARVADSPRPAAAVVGGGGWQADSAAAARSWARGSCARGMKPPVELGNALREQAPVVRAATGACPFPWPVAARRAARPFPGGGGGAVAGDDRGLGGRDGTRQQRTPTPLAAAVEDRVRAGRRLVEKVSPRRRGRAWAGGENKADS